MSKEKTPPPPRGRGRGRPPMNPEDGPMSARQIRMTDAEWAKCLRLGGAAWVRDKIAKARESK